LEPVDLGDINKPPDPDRIAKALQQLETADGVLVHCKNGWDRTGLVIGEYRVLYDNQKPDQAYAEMLRLGFHPLLHGLHEAWETFAAAHQ
jgi:protein-tyrosine phosphatase